MGGASYQCPICKRWVVTMAGMRQHWKDAHRIHKVKCEGVASHLKILSSEPMS